jgi:hypothetical protein
MENNMSYLNYVLILLGFEAFFVNAADPLAKDPALVEIGQMRKIKTFLDSGFDYYAQKQVDTCTGNSNAYSTQCGTGTAFPTDQECKGYECTSATTPGTYTTDQSCQNAGGTWSHNGGLDKKNVCCNDGSLRCKNDASGNEYEEVLAYYDRCCPVCQNSNNAGYAESCTKADLEGVSVCGTTESYCYKCMAGNYVLDDKHEASYCTSGGICSERYYMDQNSCTGASGTWTPGVWTEDGKASTGTNKKICESANFGGMCEAGTGAASSSSRDSHFQNQWQKHQCESHGTCSTSPDTTHDPASCASNSGTWVYAKWATKSQYTTESECSTAGSNACKWTKVKKFKEGNSLPAAPMQRTSCTTGGLNEMNYPANMCYNAAPYIDDAKDGKTVAEAVALNKTVTWKGSMVEYTGEEIYKWGMGVRPLVRPVITNNESAVDPATILINTTLVGSNGDFEDVAKCFIEVYEPKNTAKIEFHGSAKSDVYIVKPTNYAGAEIKVTGGSFTVLGGTNAGPININTNGQIRLYGLTNSGSVVATGSQDVVIGNTTNEASGQIDVSDITATLVDITNRGTVNVKTGGSGVKANAYGIINEATGTIVLNTGTIEIHTVCPSAGKIQVATGVTGKIKYETGCQGTIEGSTTGAAVPGTVTVEEVGKKAVTITGKLDLTVPDADAFIADTVAMDAVKEGIAETLGVIASYVTVTAEKVRRLDDGLIDLDGVSDRRLAGTGVKISYTVDIPATASATVKSNAQANAKTATAAQYQTATAAKVTAAKGASYTVTVTAVAQVTTDDGSSSTTAAPEGSANSAYGAAINLGVACWSLLAMQLVLGQEP